MDTIDPAEKKLRTFCEGYPVRVFKKNRPIFYQGEVPQTVFFVKKGTIKLYNITNSGEEKIVGYESSGSTLPAEWLFGKSSVALYYYDTLADSELVSIPKNEFMAFINSSYHISNLLLDRFVSMYISTTLHLHALEQSKARDKLLYIFQYLVIRFGKPLGGKKQRLELRLTHQEIANLIGLTRETVSTEIGKLVKAGIVEVQDLHYVIDNDMALRILGESDFNELEL